MSVVFEFFDWIIENPSLGWIPMFIYLLIELRHPTRGVVGEINNKLTSSIIVIRALSRTNEEIDEHQVDEYLVENGMEPEDFLRKQQTQARAEHLAEKSTPNPEPEPESSASTDGTNMSTLTENPDE